MYIEHSYILIMINGDLPEDLGDLSDCDKLSMIGFRGMVKEWFVIQMIVILGFNVSLVL